jgi:hypothetical protein
VVAHKLQKRILVKWTAIKGLTALAIFFVVTLILEYIIVQSFINLGVADKETFTFNFSLPIVNSISITISPLFHLIPLGVITVLMANWVYLTKQVAIKPSRTEIPKKTVQKGGKPRKLRFLRNFFRKVEDSFINVGRKLKSAVLNSRIASYLGKKLGFTKVAVKTALTTLLIFLSFTLLIIVLAYPRSVEHSIIGFLTWNTAFHDFILATIYTAQQLGQTLAPLGEIASAINNTLVSASPGIRSSLSAFGALTQPLINLDPVGKYVICQNFAAWLSAFVALSYGQFYVKVVRYVKKKR